jgi:hypothetical protein
LSRIPVGSRINDADNGPNEVNYVGCGLGGLAIALSDLSRCSTTRVVNSLIEPLAFYEAADRMVSKRGSAPYRSDRTESWLKIKCYEERHGGSA